ncbi:D-alanine--D-alanine ligase A [Candidatus Wolfebacteria bacterium RIFCSPHIGHO2_01_FULL_48_22]|uniref:D-alanine--D-alanine ligase n=2 Tax=Parcubacteria group TaxID=1794811 RepID=A0A1F8DP84_9BACT|nr:MAG: D-alanine--D-alanine ligase A [Candidatus Kaiserbacteria bacterium RIFCSPLOWO2_01_FULL_53_17]OGM90430.1 MAG: D-alanine--D-alanine ligase A [Candidatus Wolfebacteria bacterium RIFCSPHIGHO2_01_FULL_48_22]
MKRKIWVGILFGGKSAEHEISLQSARNVVNALDRKKYDVVLIGINKAGAWLASGVSERYLALASNKPAKAPEKTREVVMLAPSGEGVLTRDSGTVEGKLDVVFPVLHGPFGEDGTVQGLLKLADVPFVGAGVLGSAVGMDKDVMKRLLRDAGIPTAKFVVVHSHEKIRFADAKKKVGLPMFVKPANMGSSIGVSKARNEKEFTQALKTAFEYDTKVLVEEFIDGREIECAVLGNENPVASVPGELVIKSEFYSYDAKYFDADAMTPSIPARLPTATIKKIQDLAVQTFKTLCCEGMGRVDSFVTKNGKVIVNEINTIPGFTNISMYPKMWEASGLPYAKLIDRLIALAIARHKKEKKLKTSRT